MLRAVDLIGGGLALSFELHEGEGAGDGVGDDQRADADLREHEGHELAAAVLELLARVRTGDGRGAARAHRAAALAQSSAPLQRHDRSRWPAVSVSLECRSTGCAKRRRMRVRPIDFTIRHRTVHLRQLPSVFRVRVVQSTDSVHGQDPI